MLNDFKAFLLRGNVVDLAVGVVVGVAFTAVVTALVGDLLTPIVAAIFGSHDFSNLKFSFNGSVFRYGHFFNAVLTFFSVAAAVFFFVVTPMARLAERAQKEEPPDPTRRRCPECVSEIPAEARRCAFCTVELAPA